MRFGLIGAIFGFLAVMAGAFGAHALRAHLQPDMLRVFETGARYQLIHALALIGVRLVLGRGMARSAVAAGWFFVVGVVLFSGSLYALALTGVRAFGAITPFGGLALLGGWLALAIRFARWGPSPGAPAHGVAPSVPVTITTGQLDRARANALLRRAMNRERNPFEDRPPRLLLIDAEQQQIVLIEDGKATASYPTSTASSGIGGQDGTYQTPPGWHRIHARIGWGEPDGTVFEDRKPTGEMWTGEQLDVDLVLTRIMTLDGLEDGVNFGEGCDSLARDIYIHGTNQEDLVGRACSHGCIRMLNADVRELFSRMREGDPVVIVSGEADGV
jgi:uncharacterized membrane protein YgdD (TMEM256/DUF423 family)/lipoprotein-anchoring transpeptidase ErfK/SrfK